MKPLVVVLIDVGLNDFLGLFKSPQRLRSDLRILWKRSIFPLD